MEFKEIYRLKEMLEKAEIPFETVEFFGGLGIKYPNRDDSICSAIEHNGSYGNDEDLIEIMGLLSDEELEHDEVAGWLTAKNVFERIQTHFKNRVKKDVGVEDEKS